MSTQGVSLRAVHRTALGLFALWAASWAVSYVHLGAAALPVALLIAGAKAVLVVLFFMELAAEPFTVRATAIVATSLLTILVLLTVLDVVTRDEAPLLPPTVAREPRVR